MRVLKINNQRASFWALLAGREKEREKARLKPLKYALMLCIATLLLVACGKEEPILPFSDLKPGMTFEEMEKIEPDIIDKTLITSLGEYKSYKLEKDYKGVKISTTFNPDQVLIWDISSPPGDADTENDFIMEIKEYCNKRYKLVQELSEDSSELSFWDEGKFRICVNISDYKGEHNVSIVIFKTQ